VRSILQNIQITVFSTSLLLSCLVVDPTYNYLGFTGIGFFKVSSLSHGTIANTEKDSDDFTLLHQLPR
jgi:hypothetical protein